MNRTIIAVVTTLLCAPATALYSAETKPAGPRIAVLRCRTTDAISFRQSCKWILTFEHDPKHQKRLGDTPVSDRHCVYYYSASENR
jgi:hypothetical protein